MARIILVGLLLLLFIKGNTQETKKTNGDGKITGKIIDSLTRKPVEYATITLFQEGNKKIANGTVTDSTGRFILTDINAGVYKIVVEFIGYAPHSITNIVIDKQNLQVDLKDIFFSQKGITLQNVTVTATNRLIENKIDKLVFNAEKDLTSQGGVATDILKKVPQVSVDIDGNVELAGSSSIQIKSIEVITNPGAKYDAQGLGGIINIILKESKVKGINGNLSLSAGTRNENGSFNLNARKNNFGLNAFISGNIRPNVNSLSSSERLTVDTIAKNDLLLSQDGSYRFKRHGIESGIGFDWTYKRKNNFTGSLHYGNFGTSGTGITNQLQEITRFYQ